MWWTSLMCGVFMQNFSRSRRFKKLSALFWCATMLLIFTGCGKAPQEPYYYKREIAQMKKAELAALKAAEEEKKYAAYNYPVKKQDICLPCRVKKLEKSLDIELKYLTETVHGKQNCKRKFRD